MVMIRLDDVETKGGLCPEGIYDAVISVAEDRVTKKTQDPMFYFEWELNGGQYVVKDWLAVMEKLLWKVKKYCEGLSIDIPEGEFELTTSDFLGKECKVEIVHETSGEHTNARIKRIIPFGIVGETDDGVPF